MSNSALVVHTNLSPNRTSPRQSTIDTITIHCMACDWSVESCGAYFAKSTTGACSHYGVGSDGRVALYCDEGDRAWCSSNGDNDHRAVTIEVACESADPYKVTDTALAALITLCADICQRNGMEKLLWEGDSSLIGQVDRQNMTVHRWFAAKACPGDYLYNLHGYIAEEVNKILEEEETMTQDVFDEMMDSWLARRAVEGGSAWDTAGELAAAVSKGLTDGMRPQSFATREEVAIMVNRSLG